jgi:transcription elongation GreA/GreB family factor
VWSTTSTASCRSRIRFGSWAGCVVEETPSDEEGATLTADSPLGLALAGHRPGDTVTYSTPQGQEQVQLLSAKYP